MSERKTRLLGRSRGHEQHKKRVQVMSGSSGGNEIRCKVGKGGVRLERNSVVWYGVVSSEVCVGFFQLSERDYVGLGECRHPVEGSISRESLRRKPSKILHWTCSNLHYKRQFPSPRVKRREYYYYYCCFRGKRYLAYLSYLYQICPFMADSSTESALTRATVA